MKPTPIVNARIALTKDDAVALGQPHQNLARPVDEFGAPGWSKDQKRLEGTQRAAKVVSALDPHRVETAEAASGRPLSFLGQKSLSLSLGPQ
jgi:hypothetical protein